jgi:hypothetical protein
MHVLYVTENFVKSPLKDNPSHGDEVVVAGSNEFSLVGCCWV